MSRGGSTSSDREQMFATPSPSLIKYLKSHKYPSSVGCLGELGNVMTAWHVGAEAFWHGWSVGKTWIDLPGDRFSNSRGGEKFLEALEKKVSPQNSHFSEISSWKSHDIFYKNCKTIHVSLLLKIFLWVLWHHSRYLKGALNLALYARKKIGT